jgi:alkanesulfonate monooxygenase SsuD/methylene tetrahydromethanopterin reductase-like flavin-dependent oxidoreductase (luciferase family)
MDRLGIALGAGLSPADTVECARLAEQAGYESVWIVEGHGGGQFSLLTACALATTSVPIYLSALFAQMLALCGEIAQGLLMVFSTLESTRVGAEHLAAGAARAQGAASMK